MNDRTTARVTKYFDENDRDPIAEHCPVCRGELVTRWVGARVFAHQTSQDRRRATPLRVCLACNVSVRIAQLPQRPLRETRDAARADVVMCCKRALYPLGVDGECIYCGARGPTINTDHES